jgi:hypothetical protein
MTTLSVSSLAASALNGVSALLEDRFAKTAPG